MALFYVCAKKTSDFVGCIGMWQWNEDLEASKLRGTRVPALLGLAFRFYVDVVHGFVQGTLRV